jgi:hypothetical protein
MGGHVVTHRPWRLVAAAALIAALSALYVVGLHRHRPWLELPDPLAVLGLFAVVLPALFAAAHHDRAFVGRRGSLLVPVALGGTLAVLGMLLALTKRDAGLMPLAVVPAAGTLALFAAAEFAAARPSARALRLVSAAGLATGVVADIGPYEGNGMIALIGLSLLGLVASRSAMEPPAAEQIFRIASVAVPTWCLLAYSLDPGAAAIYAVGAAGIITLSRTRIGLIGDAAIAGLALAITALGGWGLWAGLWAIIAWLRPDKIGPVQIEPVQVGLFGQGAGRAAEFGSPLYHVYAELGPLALLAVLTAGAVLAGTLAARLRTPARTPAALLAVGCACAFAGSIVYGVAIPDRPSEVAPLLPSHDPIVTVIAMALVGLACGGSGASPGLVRRHRFASAGVLAVILIMLTGVASWRLPTGPDVVPGSVRSADGDIVTPGEGPIGAAAWFPELHETVAPYLRCGGDNPGDRGCRPADVHLTVNAAMQEATQAVLGDRRGIVAVFAAETPGAPLALAMSRDARIPMGEFCPWLVATTSAAGEDGADICGARQKGGPMRIVFGDSACPGRPIPGTAKNGTPVTVCFEVHAGDPKEVENAIKDKILRKRNQSQQSGHPSNRSHKNHH